MSYAPIGVFDSGYGGLTILSAIREALPDFDYLYLGDNARAPYGGRSFDVIYDFTLEAVKFLFHQGCPLVIIACNTASAKALRTIQQRDLPLLQPENRVLGVIRPSTEEIGLLTKTKEVGVLATQGTVQSQSYIIELAKFHPDVMVHQHACPMWVPLIENNYHETIPGKMIIEDDILTFLNAHPNMDTLVLACTHYPILHPFIQKIVGSGIKVISQGPIVADKLDWYLAAHPEITSRLSKNASCQYFTSENKAIFAQKAATFIGHHIEAQTVDLSDF
jgi:glutamate racemase